MSVQWRVEAGLSGEVAGSSRGIDVVRSTEDVGLCSFSEPGLGELFDCLEVTIRQSRCSTYIIIEHW